MPTAATIFTTFASITALISVAIYVFGIPPKLKRAMEKKALETMGENKASYDNTDQISRIPASDQKVIKHRKKCLGNALGEGLNNPLGEKTGDLGDHLTKDFTGR